MYRDATTIHSTALGEDLGVIVYGKGGYPVVAFQTEGSKCNAYEDFGMVEALADLIEGGKVQVFSVDSIDEQTWLDQDGDKAGRAQRQEEWFRFVTDELVPWVHQRNGSELRPLATGCSLGATHAAVAALRRPDLFQGCIALSGLYRTSRYWDDWMDATLAQSDVIELLRNLPANHPYVDLYNHRQLVFCSGQGAWEGGLDDLREIDGLFQGLGVHAWCDFWGADVSHDWPWWRKQIAYFMPIVLDEARKELAQERPAQAPREDVAQPAASAGTAKEPVAEAAKKPEAKAAPKPEPAAKPAAAPKPKAEPKPAKAAATKTAPAKPAEVPATTKPATTSVKSVAPAAKPAVPAKATPAQAPAKAKPAQVPAKAVPAQTPAKATVAATPVKATLASVPAKATPAAVPAKAPATEAAKPAAATTKASAPAAKPAAKKPAAKKPTKSSRKASSSRKRSSRRSK